MKELKHLELLLNACTCDIEAKMLRAKIRALELNVLGNKKITYHKPKAEYSYKQFRVKNNPLRNLK